MAERFDHGTERVFSESSLAYRSDDSFLFAGGELWHQPPEVLCGLLSVDASSIGFPISFRTEYA